MKPCTELPHPVELPIDAIHLHWLDWKHGVGRRPLLQVLGAYLDQRAEEVRLVQADASSKPRLQDDSSGLCFNWSHSGGTALLAVGHQVELGVDVEARRRSVNVLALVERFFAESELHWLQGLSEECRDSAFLHLWTGKEAVLKALGRGIAYGLDRVALTVSAQGSLRIVHLELEGLPDEDVQLQTLPVPGKNIRAALAWIGDARRVCHFRQTESIPDSELFWPAPRQQPTSIRPA